MLAVSLPVFADQTYYAWQMKDFAIDTPLGGLRGDADRGRKIVVQRDKGNCLACHAMPIKEEAFHGTVGPSLMGVGSRLSAAQLRLRIVNQQSINPMTVMPSFYKDPQSANRIAGDYIGTTMLTAQEVEDVVAYLITLKQQVASP
jgi:sulfur-oxidizing protein SoxX